MAPSAADKCQRSRDPVIREDGSIEIPLTRGLVAVVSAEAYSLVRDYRWCAQWNRCTKSFYAYRNRLTGEPTGPTRVGMHVSVVRPLHGMLVDHVNHDTLDNRSCNLRPCTHSQNMQNRRSFAFASGTSLFKGVSWNKKDRRWRAQIMAPSPTGGDGTKLFLGNYTREEDAARAYAEAARVLHGEFAVTDTNERRN